jgi:site-specific DNA-cytosine methylase
MRALDLFCGAGGASMGLHMAGYEVTGVDINHQAHYPFSLPTVFVQHKRGRTESKAPGFDRTGQKSFVKKRSPVLY